jgi:hypothetical protein
MDHHDYQVHQQGYKVDNLWNRTKSLWLSGKNVYMASGIKAI